MIRSSRTPHFAAGTKLNTDRVRRALSCISIFPTTIQVTHSLIHTPNPGRDANMGDTKSSNESHDPISTYHDRCMQSFSSLINSTVNPVRDFGDQVSPKQLSNEFDRYKVWAGNVGARHRGSRYYISLDYRLSEASFYRRQVSALCPHPVIVIAPFLRLTSI